jgi:hypothetical protein
MFVDFALKTDSAQNLKAATTTQFHDPEIQTEF